MLQGLDPRSPNVQSRINVSKVEEFSYEPMGVFSLITFNRSTKVYVFRIQMWRCVIDHGWSDSWG